MINGISDIPGEGEGMCSFPSRSFMDIVCVAGDMVGRRSGGRASPRAALQELTEAVGPTSARPLTPRLRQRANFGTQAQQIFSSYKEPLLIREYFTKPIHKNVIFVLAVCFSASYIHKALESSNRSHGG